MQSAKLEQLREILLKNMCCLFKTAFSHLQTKNNHIQSLEAKLKETEGTLRATVKLEAAPSQQDVPTLGPPANATEPRCASTSLPSACMPCQNWTDARSRGMQAARRRSARQAQHTPQRRKRLAGA